MQGLLAPTDVLHRGADQAKHLLRAVLPRAALFREAQASRLAQKQWVAQVALQPGDLPAHRALGDMQMFGGAGEVAAVGRDPKGVQRRQRRKAFHAMSHDVGTWRV